MKKLLILILSGFIFLLNTGFSEKKDKKDINSMIDSLFFYEGNDLGAKYDNGTITLKLWSPLSTKVSVIFFDKFDQMKEIGRKELVKKNKGVWETVIKPFELNGIKDLNGYFYQYEITINDKKVRALDPYAKSMVEFKNNQEDLIGKGAIVDMSKTGKVSSYADIKGYNKRTDAIIYEIHVRDFTSDPYLKTKAQFGTYKAFIEKLDYLKDLGITHIQLLPVLSYYFGDESRNKIREMEYSVKDNNYNWGYDPHNYFSPEGMYSENPKDPVLRIKELKELIEAIHKSGMGVILDVVYNHTAKVEIFENLLPGYYYRMNDDGTFTSNSGCGNDIATTNKMVRKLIVDSVKYWVEEYKVDGFRFDLMGLIDTETIYRAYSEAVKLNPKILFLGEGWRMYNGPAGTKGADQDWMEYTNDVAVFSDSFRDLLKFGGFNEGVPAFLTGKPTSIIDIFKNQKGYPTNFISNSPANVVQYIEAHDGLTYHDTICVSLNLNPQKDKDEIYKRMKLGNLMTLTSQGVAFLHAGQEFGRTKEWKGNGLPPCENKEGTPFIKNSYDSSDIINKIDWKQMEEKHSKELIEYTKNLIKLRKSTDAFRLADYKLIDENVKLIESANNKKYDLSIGFSCKSTDNKTFYIFVNADKVPKTIPMKEDLTKGIVIADSKEVSLNGIKNISGIRLKPDNITVDPLTAAIIMIQN